MIYLFHMEKEMETLTWSVFEYEEKNRSIDWYWTVGLISLAIIIASIYFKNYFFAVLIFISVITLLYLTIRKPEELSITLNKDGIRVRNELFMYRTLKGFWIEEPSSNGHPRHLLILTDRVYSPMVAIPIGDIAPEILRMKLKPFVEEKEMQENPSHRFIEMLGF